MSLLEDPGAARSAPVVSAPCSSRVFAALIDGTHIDFASAVFG